MGRTKLADEFQIEVDGEPYIWRLQRRPQWAKDVKARRGMAIGVRHANGQREAVIEFPPGEQPKFGAPMFKVEQVDRALVARATASAIAAGWEPHSRGKTVEIVVDENGA